MHPFLAFYIWTAMLPHVLTGAIKSADGREVDRD